jgi:hypothetical protein
VLDALGEPQVAGTADARRIRTLVEECSREIDPGVRVDDAGLVDFGAATRMSPAAVDAPDPAP